VDLQIREATQTDLQRILELYREAGLDTDGSLHPQEASEIMKSMHAYPNYRLFVAEEVGQIVGTFALLIMDNLGHRGAKSGVVEAVAVLPSLQGKGIGKKMMQFALDRCKDYGCYKMMLSSNESQTNAHQFYESLGFTRHGFSFRVAL